MLPGYNLPPQPGKRTLQRPKQIQAWFIARSLYLDKGCNGAQIAQLVQRHYARVLQHFPGLRSQVG